MPREPNFGNIFSDTFNVYFKNWRQFFLPFALLSFAVSVPIDLAVYYYLGLPPGGFQPGTQGLPNLRVENLLTAVLIIIVDIVVAIILGAIVTGGMSFFAVERHREHPVALATAIKRGLDHFLSIIGASILVGLVVGGLFLLAFAMVIGGIVGRSLGLIGIGFILLLVPIPVAIFLGIALSLFTPAIMMENEDAIGSLGRSWRLTQGRRLSLFGAYLLLGIIGAIISAVITLPANLTRNPVVSAADAALARGIVGSWSLIGAAVAYDLIVRYTPASFQYYGPGWGTPAPPYMPQHQPPPPPGP